MEFDNYIRSDEGLMLKIVSSHASKICSLALTYLIPNLSCVSPQLLQSVKDMVAVNHKHMNRIEQYTTSYLEISVRLGSQIFTNSKRIYGLRLRLTLIV